MNKMTSKLLLKIGKMLHNNGLDFSNIGISTYFGKCHFGISFRNPTKFGKDFVSFICLLFHSSSIEKHIQRFHVKNRMFLPFLDDR